MTASHVPEKQARMACDNGGIMRADPDVRISRIRRSQIPLAAGMRKEWTGHLHRHQAQVGQLAIPGDSFRGPEGPLAPQCRIKR